MKAVKYGNALRGYAHDILKRDDFTCRYCGWDGKVWPNRLYLSWDHLLPVGHPERDEPAFIGAACRFCNEANNKPKREATPELTMPAACKACGVILEDRTRQYCDGCLPDYRESQVSSYIEAGRARLKELRVSGIDPSQTGDAAEKRRTIMTQRRREEAEWNAEHRDDDVDESVFRTEILPRLQGLSLSTIAAATGLSQQYCSLIRRGLKVPHIRHWEPLRAANSHNRYSQR